jgi:hypothetical protein
MRSISGLIPYYTRIHINTVGLQKENAMPITYSVYREGHFIHAIAESPLTAKKFVDYEVAHSIDKRIKTLVCHTTVIFRKPIGKGLKKVEKGKLKG